MGKIKNFLNKDIYGVKVYWLLLTALIGLVGIIVGSIYDLKLSSSLYDKNNAFSNFVETFGEGIGYLSGCIGGTLLFLGLYKNNKLIFRILGYFLLVFPVVLSTILYGKAIGPNEYGITISKPYNYVFAVTISIIVCLITYFIVNKKEYRSLIISGSVIAISIILTVAIVNGGLKFIGGRPRYRYLIGDAISKDGLNESYKNWWQFQPFKYLSGDYHKSWPSGHVGITTCLLSISFITPVLNKSNKWSCLIIFSIMSIITLVICICRIIAGAHFLSDVSTSIFLVSLVILLSSYIVELFDNKFSKSKLENIENSNN